MHTNCLEKLQGRITFTSIAIKVRKQLLGKMDKVLNIANKKKYSHISVNNVLIQYFTTCTSILKLIIGGWNHLFCPTYLYNPLVYSGHD